MGSTKATRWLLFGLALLLILAGGYRLAGALVSVPGNVVISQLRAGEPVGEADWRKLEESHAAAGDMFPAPLFWNAVGRARMEQQTVGNDGQAEDPSALEPALAAYGRSLEASPVNGRAWAGIARIRKLQGRPVEEVLEAVALSRSSDPHDLGLKVFRSLLLRAEFKTLPKAERSAIRRDAREAFTARPWPLVRQVMGLGAADYYMFLLADNRTAFRHYMKLVAIERRRLAREAKAAAADQ